MKSVARVALLVGLLALTAWNLSRSTKLEAASTAFRAKRYVIALQSAKEHLRLRPWSREANRIAGLSLSALDFSNEAEEYYKKAGTLSQQDLESRAYGILRSNRREAAIAAYREILARWPTDPSALRNIATIYMSQWQNREAIEFAERLSVIPGHEVVGSTMLGSLLHRLGETERAVAAFERVAKLDPDLKEMPLPAWQFRLYFAEELINAGRAQDAATILENAVAATPDNILLFDRLGMAYESLGRLDDAEAAWKREIELDADTAEAWTHLGKLTLVRNQPAEALVLLRKAVELQPNSYTALYNLLLATQRLGMRDEAKALKVRLEAVRSKDGTPTAKMGSTSTISEESYD
jgi:tetratricopeptide (TPR) repeat protein